MPSSHSKLCGEYSLSSSSTNSQALLPRRNLISTLPMELIWMIASHPSEAQECATLFWASADFRLALLPMVDPAAAMYVAITSLDPNLFHLALALFGPSSIVQAVRHAGCYPMGWWDEEDPMYAFSKLIEAGHKLFFRQIWRIWVQESGITVGQALEIEDQMWYFSLLNAVAKAHDTETLEEIIEYASLDDHLETIQLCLYANNAHMAEVFMRNHGGFDYQDWQDEMDFIAFDYIEEAIESLDVDRFSLLFNYIYGDTETMFGEADEALCVRIERTNTTILATVYIAQVGLAYYKTSPGVLIFWKNLLKQGPYWPESDRWDDEGKTLLHHLAENGSHRYSYPWMEPDTDSPPWTVDCLYSAMLQEMRVPYVREIIDIKTEVDHRTALHIAVAQGEGIMVRFLLRHHANCNIKDANGHYAWDNASFGNNPKRFGLAHEVWKMAMMQRGKPVQEIFTRRKVKAALDWRAFKLKLQMEDLSRRIAEAEAERNDEESDEENDEESDGVEEMEHVDENLGYWMYVEKEKYFNLDMGDDELEPKEEGCIPMDEEQVISWDDDSESGSVNGGVKGDEELIDSPDCEGEM